MHYEAMKKFGLTVSMFNEALQFEGHYIGRVLSQSKDVYRVITEAGEFFAEVSGKYRFLAQTISDYPAVGDFVMLDRANGSAGNGIIHQLLSRKSVFIRKAAGNPTRGKSSLPTSTPHLSVCL